MSNGVAFVGAGKLVQKATGYEQKQRKPRYLELGSPGCAGRTHRRRLDIGDPQISPTRHFFSRLRSALRPTGPALPPSNKTLRV